MNCLKISGIAIAKAFGIALMCQGLVVEKYYLIGIGFLITDLTPSFLKATIKSAIKDK